MFSELFMFFFVLFVPLLHISMQFSQTFQLSCHYVYNIVKTKILTKIHHECLECGP